MPRETAAAKHQRLLAAEDAMRARIRAQVEAEFAASKRDRLAALEEKMREATTEAIRERLDEIAAECADAMLAVLREHGWRITGEPGVPEPLAFQLDDHLTAAARRELDFALDYGF